MLTHDRRHTIVIKIGGAVLADAGSFETVLDALTRLTALLDRGDGSPATARSVGPGLPRDDHCVTFLILPGGGPFADTVRDVDARYDAGDDAAHWMAILAMDQYAHLLASRLTRSELIDEPARADSVCRAGRIPVLAPYRRLRTADPLPHSWDVTSDSLAAWLALDIGADELILVKPAPAPIEALTDAYFPAVVAADRRTQNRLAVHSCTPGELLGVIVNWGPGTGSR